VKITKILSPTFYCCILNGIIHCTRSIKNKRNPSTNTGDAKRSIFTVLGLFTSGGLAPTGEKAEGVQGGVTNGSDDMIEYKSKRNQTRNYLSRHICSCCRIRAGSPKFIKFCDLNFFFLLHLQKAGLSQINPKKRANATL
jgi:hypothetical protein